jgi:hypothetical protein
MALTGVYTGAALAYSLRNLSGYTGDVARIRRSSDNAELDFTGAEITDGTLLTWVGANSAYVVTLYDQTGNGYDVTQSTAANQPRIVNAGTLDTKNGLPAAKFDGTNDRLLYATGVLNTADLTLISVAATASTEAFGITIALSDSTAQTARMLIDSRSTVKRNLLVTNTGNTTYAADLDDYIVSTDLRIQECYIDASRNMSSYANGVAGTTATHTGTITSDGVQIGAQANALTLLNGYISEVIAWNDDVSADRADIYEDIRSYYFDTALEGENVATGAPTVTAATLAEEAGANDALTSTNVATGAPTVTTSTLTQEHALTGSDVATGAPTITEPTLTEQSEQALTSTNVATGAPTVTEPTLTETNPSKVVARREILSDLGRRWRIEIHDQDETSGIDFDLENITVRSDGFTLDYESPNDDIFEAIKASKCSTTLVVDPTDTAIITLITDIAQSEEGRFYLLIKEYNTSTLEWDWYWWGQILTDLVKEPDKWPSEVDLVATDGLGLMADTNYNPTAGGLFTGLNTFGEIIAKAINRVKQGEDIRDTDHFIKTGNNWFNAAMDTTTLDPMLQTAIRQEAFWQEDSREGITTFKPSKISDVMDAVLFGWNARIILAKGYYHIENTALYKDIGISRQVIDTDGAAVGTRTLENVELDIDQTDIYTTHGGYREWAKPLKEVVRIHNHAGSDNVLSPSEVYNPAVAFPWSGQAFITNVVGDNKRLRVRFLIRVRITNQKAADFTVPYIGMKAKLLLSDGVAVANLYKPTMSTQMSFSANTNERYGFFAGPFAPIAEDEQAETLVLVDFETPNFVSDDFDTNEFEIDFGDNSASAAYKLFYPNVGSNVGLNIADVTELDWADDPFDVAYNNDLILQYKVLGAQILFNDGNTNEKEYIAENTALTNSNTYEYPIEIPFGDVVNHLVEPGAFRVWDGAAYVSNQNGWGLGAPIDPLTHNLAFHELAVQQAAAMRNVPQDRQYFDIYGVIDPINCLGYGGSRYAFIGGSFTARADRWKGYWQRVAVDNTTIVQSGDDIIMQPLFNPATVVHSQLLAQGQLMNFSTIKPWSGGVTSGVLTAGDTITSIPIFAPGHGGIKSGMVIQVVDPFTGAQGSFTVGADVGAGDTSITVSSVTLDDGFSINSEVIIPATNYFDVLGDIYEGTFTGIEGWTPSLNTASPNNTVNASRMLASGGSTNQDAIIQPKGTGALLAQLPDNTNTQGNKRGDRAVDLQMIRGLADQVASGTQAVIGGGNANKATATNSTIAGGASNLVSGQAATIAGGSGNTGSADYVAVTGGQSNIASALHSFIGGGDNNTASGINSAILGGKYGSANKTGMVAHAASRFSANGDNQREYYELSKITTDDTPTILTADQATPAAANTIAIESGAAYAYQIMLSALCITDSTTASYISVGNVYNNAGTLSGADTVINDHNDIGLITISVNFNSTDDRLDIEVEGISAKTIRWGATVTMRKVK